MIRKKVLGVGVNSATLLVEDAHLGNSLQVLRRFNVSDWSKEEIKCSIKIYEKIKEKFSSLGHVARISTVLHQKNFLNIVTSYYESGDLALFLEDAKTNFTSSTVCSWLLMVAEGVKELHSRTSSCFYGFELEHIFIEAFGTRKDAESIITRLRVGIPTPERSYFSVLEEKKSSGADLTNQYPSEVLENNKYHPQRSDIFHLGVLADRLLQSTRIPLSSQPERLSALMNAMKNSKMECRPDIDHVITELSALVVSPETAGKEVKEKCVGEQSSSTFPKVSRHGQRLSSREVIRSASKKQENVKDKRKMNQKSEERNIKPQVSASSRGSKSLLAPTVTELLPLSKKGTPEEKSSSPRRRREVNLNWHDGAFKKLEELELARLQPSGLQGNPKEKNVADLARFHNAFADQKVDVQRGHEDDGLSHRYIDAAEGLNFETGTAAPFQFKREVLQNGKMDPNTRVIQQMLGDSPMVSNSIKKGQSLNRSTSPKHPLFSEKKDEGMAKKKMTGRPKGFSNPPFQYAKSTSGGIPVYTTKVDDAAEKRHTGRKKLRQAEKKLSQKVESCLVSATDGVLIYTPYLQRTKPEENQKRQEWIDANVENPVEGRSNGIERNGKRDGEGILLPSERPPSVESIHSVRRNSVPPHSVSVSSSHYRCSQPPSQVEENVSHCTVDPSPRETTPLPLSFLQTGQSPPYLVRPTDTVSYRPVSPKAERAAPEPNEQPSIVSYLSSSSVEDSKRDTRLPTAIIDSLHSSNEHEWHTTSLVTEESFSAKSKATPHRNLAPQRPPSGISLTGTSNRVTRRTEQLNISLEEESKKKSKRTPRTSSQRPASLAPAMIEWTVDSLRGCIRSLVKDRTRYGELMVEIAAFVRKSEEERLSVKENSKLMRCIKSKLHMEDDERTRDAAISLCTQLVALEGLGRLLSEPKD